MAWLFAAASCTAEPVTAAGARDRMIREMVAANDRDRDGCLSRSEWNAMADIATATVKAENAENLDDLGRAYRDAFVRFDLDRNECITAAEYGAVTA